MIKSRAALYLSDPRIGGRERFVDRFIFVVEWGKTHRRLVQEALAEVEIIRDRLMCIVLNKADPGALRSIEAYKGARFGDYYVA